MTSAFGKVILLGEHAVVYGHPALAGAIDLRVAVRATPAETSSLAIPAWSVRVNADDDGPIAEALRALLESTHSAAEGWRIAATATLPPRAGLGSSAALSVAIARALATAHHEHPATDEIENRAAAGERCFHRNPSGVDVAVAARGGLGRFRAGGGFEPIAAEPIPVVVGLTGEARETSAMVEAVAAARKADSKRVDADLEKLGALAEHGAAVATAGDLDELAALMTDAQSVLASLGVSSPGIEALVEAALESGAAGAKLTGAGGGGAVIAIAPGHEGEVARAWRALGKEVFVSRVGVGGK